MKGYLRKHFHSVAINLHDLDTSEICDFDSMVVYANHSSWWDAISAMFFAWQVFPNHRQYAPIDAEALEKYQMFANMGFYGVQQSSLRGAADFLRKSTAILDHAGSAIWITPEGRFVDVRDTEAPLSSGLSHLASRLAVRASQAAEPPRKVWFIPGAVEYTFWEERKPELLCQFGTPVCVTDTELLNGKFAPSDKAAWNQLLTARLRTAQKQLATAAIERDSSYFRVVVGGKSGTFFLYDWYRRSKSLLRGKSIDIDHSQKLR